MTRQPTTRGAAVARGLLRPCPAIVRADTHAQHGADSSVADPAGKAGLRAGFAGRMSRARRIPCSMQLMANPAFIYAFDNLGPERFYELCGLLLGARHKGFLLSGPGPDGGVDAELDLALAEWQPEVDDAVDALIVTAQDKVVFQMKHKVVARAGGQARARDQLLANYRSKTGGELSNPRLRAMNPTAYVLVTNVEVNTLFRTNFIAACEAALPELQQAQIIGLDELASWVCMDAQLRHLYFPTM